MIDHDTRMTERFTNFQCVAEVRFNCSFTNNTVPIMLLNLRDTVVSDMTVSPTEELYG